MDIISDLAETIGLQRGHFDLLIGIVILTGSIWATIRLYQDLSGPPIDFGHEQDKEEN